MTDLERRLSKLRSVIEIDEGSGAPAPDLDPQTLAQLQALGYAAGQGGVSLDEEEDRPRADPKDRIGVHRTVMRAQTLMGRNVEEAEKILLTVLQEDPEILDAHQMLGQIAATQQRFDEALGYYRRALAIEPDHKSSGSWAWLPAIRRSRIESDEALVGFRRVLEVGGHDTRASLAIADIEFGQGDFDQAARSLEDAAKTTEAPALIHNKLGEVRVEQGRFDDAVALFETAIAEHEEFAVPHFNLAVLLEERGDLEAAKGHYEKAIELAPNYHEALFNLGFLVGDQGQVDRQQELWEGSIESNPNFVQGYYYLAKLMMDRGGDLRRAEELVRLGIGKDPDHNDGPLGYYILADILNRTGRAAEAKDAVATGRRIQAEMK